MKGSRKRPRATAARKVEPSREPPPASGHEPRAAVPAVEAPTSPYTLLQGLSPRWREIIRPVLETPRAFVLLPVRAVAQQLGSDPATTLRIVRRLGFARYRDFQHYLHELSIAHATSLNARPWFVSS